MGNSKTKSSQPPVSNPVYPSIDVLLAQIANDYDTSDGGKLRSESLSSLSEIESRPIDFMTIAELIDVLFVSPNDYDVMQMLKIKVSQLTHDALENFWYEHSNILLAQIKNTPDSCAEYRMHELSELNKKKYMEKLAILIFSTSMEIALMLLNSNFNLASKLLQKDYKDQSNFISADMNNKRVLNCAYDCQKNHRYGMAHLLFLKAGYPKGADNIIEFRAPEYIKRLMFRENIVSNTVSER